MGLFSRRRKDWQIVQQARADFVIQRLRASIADSSLWHEKRFRLAQLESLAIVSIAGVYHVNTYDATAQNFSHDDDLLTIGDLALSVVRDTRSHHGLSEQQNEEVIVDANAEFNSLVGSGDSIGTVFSRVTCNIDFQSPTHDVEQYGGELLGEVAAKLGYPLTYVPYVTNDIWPRTSDYHNTKPAPQYARSAGEFVFDPPRLVADVTLKVQSLVESTRPLRATGIHGTIAGIDNLYDVHLIGRRF